VNVMPEFGSPIKFFPALRRIALPFAAAVLSIYQLPVSALALIEVQSRKTHGGTVEFNLHINPVPAIADALTVEPRELGTGHKIVFKFDGPVSTPGTVTINDELYTSVNLYSVNAISNEVIVQLPNVADNKRMTISLKNVSGVAGLNASASIGFLVGDVNQSGAVSASDISAVKARLNTPVALENFRFDINTSGVIDASDLASIRSRSGRMLANVPRPPGYWRLDYEIAASGLVTPRPVVTWQFGKPDLIAFPAGNGSKGSIFFDDISNDVVFQNTSLNAGKVRTTLPLAFRTADNRFSFSIPTGKSQAGSAGIRTEEGQRQFQFDVVTRAPTFLSGTFRIDSMGIFTAGFNTDPSFWIVAPTFSTGNWTANFILDTRPQTQSNGYFFCFLDSAQPQMAFPSDPADPNYLLVNPREKPGWVGNPVINGCIYGTPDPD
jgi:hypothetical protein